MKGLHRHIVLTSRMLDCVFEITVNRIKGRFLMFKDTPAYMVWPLFLTPVCIHHSTGKSSKRNWQEPKSVMEEEEQICAMHPSLVPRCCCITKCLSRLG